MDTRLRIVDMYLIYGVGTPYSLVSDSQPQNQLPQALSLAGFAVEYGMYVRGQAR
jgi:hypothetical protein